MMVVRMLRTFTVVAGCLLWAAGLQAQSAENVAVVINEASSESQQIGEHYARVRALPQANVFRIRTSTDDVIERQAYVDTIERPIGETIRRLGLQDRLLYVVLTKGVPLRIAGTTGLKGTQASVDSELTLLYRRLTGQAVPTPGVIENRISSPRAKSAKPDLSLIASTISIS